MAYSKSGINSIIKSLEGIVTSSDYSMGRDALESSISTVVLKAFPMLERYHNTFNFKGSLINLSFSLSDDFNIDVKELAKQNNMSVSDLQDLSDPHVIFKVDVDSNGQASITCEAETMYTNNDSLDDETIDYIVSKKDFKVDMNLSKSKVTNSKVKDSNNSTRPTMTKPKLKTIIKNIEKLIHSIDLSRDKFNIDNDLDDQIRSRYPQLVPYGVAMAVNGEKADLAYTMNADFDVNVKAFAKMLDKSPGNIEDMETDYIMFSIDIDGSGNVVIDCDAVVNYTDAFYEEDAQEYFSLGITSEFKANIDPIVSGGVNEKPDNTEINDNNYGDSEPTNQGIHIENDTKFGTYNVMDGNKIILSISHNRTTLKALEKDIKAYVDGDVDIEYLDNKYSAYSSSNKASGANTNMAKGIEGIADKITSTLESLSYTNISYLGGNIINAKMDVGIVSGHVEIEYRESTYTITLKDDVPEVTQIYKTIMSLKDYKNSYDNSWYKAKKISALDVMEDFKGEVELLNKVIQEKINSNKGNMMMAMVVELNKYVVSKGFQVSEMNSNSNIINATYKLNGDNDSVPGISVQGVINDSKLDITFMGMTLSVKSLKDATNELDKIRVEIDKIVANNQAIQKANDVQKQDTDVEDNTKEVPKAETKAKVNSKLDADQKAQLMRLQTIAKKLAPHIDANEAFNLVFLEEPKEMLKYNLPVPVLGFYCYDLTKSMSELDSDPLTKLITRARGTKIFLRWHRGVDMKGEKCWLTFFCDSKWADENGVDYRKVKYRNKKLRLDESVGSYIDYENESYLLESVGNKFMRLSNDKGTLLVPLNEINIYKGVFLCN